MLVVICDIGRIGKSSVKRIGLLELSSCQLLD